MKIELTNNNLQVDGIQGKEIEDIALLCAKIRDYMKTYGHKHVQIDGDGIVIFSEDDVEGNWNTITLGFDGMRLIKYEKSHFDKHGNAISK